MFYTEGAKHILSYWHNQPRCDAKIAILAMLFYKARESGGMPRDRSILPA